MNFEESEGMKGRCLDDAVMMRLCSQFKSLFYSQKPCTILIEKFLLEKFLLNLSKALYTLWLKVGEWSGPDGHSNSYSNIHSKWSMTICHSNIQMIRRDHRKLSFIQ